MPEPNTGCFLWLAQLNHNGYGRFSFRGRPMRAHRIAWLLTHGAIPAGLFVLHRCDNRACVNVDHLFLGTARDNSDDMRRKGRQILGLTPETRARGARVNTAKLTVRKVRTIRRRYRNGESQRQLARAFGVSQPAIGYIVRGKHWRHVIEESK